MKKRALVMTGGAARGAFMAGVVDGLVSDQNLDFDVVAGVSIGALIAANLAQARRGQNDRESRLALLRTNLRLVEAVRTRLPRQEWLKYWPLLGNRRRRTIREIVEETISIEELSRSERKFFGGAVDLWTGRWRLRDETTIESVEEILGMMAMPLLDPPVRVGRDLWVDGILRRTAPIEEVLAEGVDELYVVAAGFPPIGPTLRARGAFRALAIALGELAYDKEIRLAYLVERTWGRPRVILIRPGRELHGRLSLSPADFEFSLAHGREQANRACQPGHGGPLFDEEVDQPLVEEVRALSDPPPDSHAEGAS